MIEAYNSTLPYRLVGAALIFLGLGIRDWIKHPENPTRVKEYLFLVASMLLAIVYGIVHDHLTATISPDYFLNAKGLDQDPRPYRWAVTWLAIKACYGPGALTGALMLIANNPAKKPGHEKPQLSYPHMLRLCVYPVLGAAICAAVIGCVCFLFGGKTWLGDAALAYAPAEQADRFLAVWGIHAGSYAGASLGTVVVIVMIVGARKRLASANAG